MNVVSDAVEEWAESIRRSLATRMARAEQDTKITLTPSDAVTINDIITFAANPEFVSQTIKEFLDDYMLGPLGGEWSFYQQWQKRMANERDHWLKFEKKVSLSRAKQYNEEKAQKSGSKQQAQSQFKEREKDEAPTTKGFKAVWQAFSQSRVRRRSSGLYKFDIGPLSDLMKLNASTYSPFRVKSVSELDSLFLNVEYGTGIAENVGSPRFVRREGMSKYVGPNGPDGSWWLTSPNNVGDGTRVLGQKGFHFLYDARTREPHGGYMEYFRVEFPKFFVAQIAKRLQSKVG